MLVTIVLLTIPEKPAHAIFLNDLSNHLTNVVQQSTAGAIIHESALATAFNILRGVFLTLIAAATIYGTLYHQESESEKEAD